MKYIKTYENKILNLDKFIILSYKKHNANMISLFELSKSKLTVRTHKTYYEGGRTIRFEKGDTLYKFYQTYIVIPNEYEILYQTDNLNDALENFDLSIEANKYNL